MSKDRVNIIKVASNEPLAFYSAIAIFTVASLLLSLTVVERVDIRFSMVVGVILIVIAMMLFVRYGLVKKKTGTVPEFPSHGSPLGEEAIKGFFAGGDASRLEGRWKVQWFVDIGTGKMSPYMVKDPVTGEMKPYLPEIASIKTHGAMISVENHNPTTKYVYYLEGRMSVKNTVTLIYWSKANVSESMLVGTVCLTADFSFQSATMSGTWTGYTRDGKLSHGEVKWRRLTKS
jgi:hypothetical protein